MEGEKKKEKKRGERRKKKEKFSIFGWVGSLSF